eukprot:TRINITY_DN16809_c0_g1_i5.p1 TRINITY_DN16809_c0_g1~~TRINITY_DN16809_c0_g1_i5.p1  ORF type:complete len:386 (-),score=52.82 TRINITY_DN16809_c0_g1_i5:22-1179(-)
MFVSLWKAFFCGLLLIYCCYAQQDVQNLLRQISELKLENERLRAKVDGSDSTTCSGGFWLQENWPWFTGGDNLQGTAEFQQWLYRYQHPMTCDNQRFLVWRMWQHGIGSDIHGLSYGLAVAIMMGRILLIDDVNTPWMYAQNVAPPSLHYYFVPISNCTLQHAQPIQYYANHTSAATFRSIYSVRHRESGGMKAQYPLSSIPPRWRHLGLSWWRAQSTRYLLRKIQPPLAEALCRVKQEIAPYGFPRPLISVHVRHGDKWIEMDLLPFSQYMAAAEAIRKQNPLVRTIFLSTENQHVIEQARTYKNWTFLYTHNLRLNVSPMESASVLGWETEAMISFVNLYLALEGDYFIGTRKSNWCRLIDELRQTGNKMSNGYVNLGGEHEE